MHLEKGCIFIAVIGLAASGIIFVIHENLWTVLSLALSVVSGGFLLAGAIKYTRISIIIYVLLEILHITEMFAACIIIFVDLYVCNTCLRLGTSRISEPRTRRVSLTRNCTDALCIHCLPVEVRLQRRFSCSEGRA